MCAFWVGAADVVLLLPFFQPTKAPDKVESLSTHLSLSWACCVPATHTHTHAPAPTTHPTHLKQHRWPLDYATDASFAGQLPLLSVPAFSQPQPYPLVLLQQATPAQGGNGGGGGGSGGGWMVHMFLDASEVAGMRAALAEQGGL